MTDDTSLNSMGRMLDYLPYTSKPEEIAIAGDTSQGIPNVNELLKAERDRVRRITCVRLKGGFRGHYTRNPNNNEEDVYQSIERLLTGLGSLTTVVLDYIGVESIMLNIVIKVLPRLQHLAMQSISLGDCTNDDLQNFAAALRNARGLRQLTCGQLWLVQKKREHGFWDQSTRVADVVADAIEQLDHLEHLVLHIFHHPRLETWGQRRPLASRVTLMFEDSAEPTDWNWNWFVSHEAPTKRLSLRGHVNEVSLPDITWSVPRERSLHVHSFDSMTSKRSMKLIRTVARAFSDVRIVITGERNSLLFDLKRVAITFDALANVVQHILIVEWRPFKIPMQDTTLFSRGFPFIDHTQSLLVNATGRSRLKIVASAFDYPLILKAMKKADEFNIHNGENHSWWWLMDRGWVSIVKQEKESITTFNVIPTESSH